MAIWASSSCLRVSPGWGAWESDSLDLHRHKIELLEFRSLVQWIVYLTLVVMKEG